MELKDYPREFVERTIRLLKEGSECMSKKGLEVTFFLNCLLGLIIATLENLDKCNSGFFQKRLTEDEIILYLPKKVGQINFKETFKKYVEEINKKSLIGQLDEKIYFDTEVNIETYKNVKNLTLEKFLKKIRNGVAHQNIMPVNENGDWKGLRIWNFDRNGIKDFEIEFKINELKSFAIFIAERYLLELNSRPGNHKG